MSLEFTGIARGIELDNATVVLPLVGNPGGGDSDVVAIGSIGLSDNGNIFRKRTAGAGADKWENIGGVDQLSWREPAFVKEDANFASLAAAETSMNLGTVDGEAVSTDDRILYTNIDGENRNVFTITGTVGAGATLVEDVNAATLNDVIRIDSGTSAELVFYFDGATWVAPDAAVLAELVNIRAFIGKPSAGAVLPQYTSEQVVTDDQALNVAISNLDAVANVPDNSLAVPAATPTVVASVLVDNFRRVVWEVSVFDTVDDRFEGISISALHDGEGANDAALTDSSGFGRDRTGNPIAGLDYTVGLSGAGASQTMTLTFTATNICDVTVMRAGYTAAS